MTAEARRAALVEATLDTIAAEGLAAATLRRVADRAGVSNGLIRHHFSGKQQMLMAAYAELIARMTEPCRLVLARRDLPPRARLAAFVRANFHPDVVDPRVFSIWASFISLIHVDADMAAIHRDGYLSFRAALEPLIADARAEAGRAPDPARVETLATQLNAFLDGLWIEGCLLPGDFDAGALETLALAGAGRVLDLVLEG